MDITITTEQLDKAFGIVDGFTDEQAIAYMEGLSRQQPVLLANFMAMIQDIDDEVMEDALFVCTVIYKTYELAVKSIPRVMEETVEGMDAFFADEKNVDGFSLDTEDVAGTLARLGVDQPVFAEFIFDVMLGDSADEDWLEADELTQGMLAIIIFAKCLDDTIKGTGLKAVK